MAGIIESYDSAISKQDNYFGYPTRAHISYESLKSDIQYQVSKTGKQGVISLTNEYHDTGTIENLLLIASSLGLADIIKSMMHRINNLEARDPYGKTMLANASVNGHNEIVKLLISFSNTSDG